MGWRQVAADPDLAGRQKLSTPLGAKSAVYSAPLAADAAIAFGASPANQNANAVPQGGSLFTLTL